jgi:hypothetical protein
MTSAQERMHQVFVSRQMRPNLGDNNSKLAGRGELQCQLLAVLVVELLRATDCKELHGNCKVKIKQQYKRLLDASRTQRSM